MLPRIVAVNRTACPYIQTFNHNRDSGEVSSRASNRHPWTTPNTESPILSLLRASDGPSSCHPERSRGICPRTRSAPRTRPDVSTTLRFARHDKKGTRRASPREHKPKSLSLSQVKCAFHISFPASNRPSACHSERRIATPSRHLQRRIAPLLPPRVSNRHPWATTEH